MDVQVLENGDFYYTYKIKKGISKIKGAIRVMKDMKYPSEIIDAMMGSGEP
jgi:DNA mismatch repair ATPase MutS